MLRSVYLAQRGLRDVEGTSSTRGKAELLSTSRKRRFRKVRRVVSGENCILVLVRRASDVLLEKWSYS